jgi:hypothetical protein
MSGRVLYEGKIPIALGGFDAGQARVVVLEGEPVHPPQEGCNEFFLVAEGQYVGETYRVTAGKGGIPEVLDDLRAKIEKEIAGRS